MIEVAMVLPVLLLIVFLTFNLEWSVFQAEEIRDGADAAMRIASVPCGANPTLPTDVAMENCISSVLDRLRSTTPTLPFPKDSDADTCLIPLGASVRTDAFECAGNPDLCVRAVPTFFSPSEVQTVLKYKLQPLGPVSLFAVTVASTASSTVSASGVPGAPAPLSCP